MTFASAMDDEALMEWKDWGKTSTVTKSREKKNREKGRNEKEGQ